MLKENLEGKRWLERLKLKWKDGVKKNLEILGANENMANEEYEGC